MRANRASSTQTIVLVLFIVLVLASLLILILINSDTDHAIEPLANLPGTEKGSINAGGSIEVKAHGNARLPLTAAGVDRLDIDGFKNDMPEFGDEPGPGWRIWGQVTDRSRASSPIVGAELLFFMKKKNSDIVMLIDPLLSDHEGCFAATITLSQTPLFPPSQLEEDKEIYCMVKHPGYLSDEVYIDGDNENGGFVIDEVRFDLQPAPVVYGTVLNHEGKPQSEADVYYLNGNSWWIKEADVQGVFQLFNDHFHPTPTHVWAFKDGVGASVKAKVETDNEGKIIPPVLMLSKCESIVGAIEYPDGRPVCGVLAQAWPAELVKDSIDDLEYMQSVDYEELGEYLCSNQSAQWNGFAFGSAFTDLNGRFSISGLKKGAYFIRIEDYKNFEITETEPPRVKCATGDKDVLLIMEKHMAELHFRDAKGFLIPDVYMRCDIIDDGLLCEYDSGYIVDGVHRIQVPPGGVDIYCEAAGNRMVEQRLERNWYDFEMKVDLTLSIPKPGKLRITVVDFNNHRIPWTPGVLVYLTSKQNQVRQKIAGADWDKRGDLLIEGPMGHYKLFMDLTKNDAPSPDNMCTKFQTTDVEILSGRENRVYVKAELGGRLRLAFSGGDKGELPSFWRIAAFISKDGKRPSKKEIERNLSRIDISYLFKGDQLIDLWSSEKLSSSTPYIVDTIFKPGEYWLIVYSTDSELFESSFEIKPGQYTDLDVNLGLAKSGGLP